MKASIYVRDAVASIRREWQFIGATFAASGVGYLGSAGAPFIVQALIESGLNTKQAGDLGTVELTMLAVTSTLVTPVVTRISHRQLALGGAAMAAVGLLISVLSESYGVMMVGRLLTGSGSGFAISGANAAVAAREDAERVFALIWTLGGGITAALANGLPRVVEGGNYPMGFAVLLVLCLAGMPLMVWVPPRPHSYGDRTTPVDGNDTPGSEGSTSLSGPKGTADSSAVVLSIPAVLALLGVFIYSAAEQALWNFGFYIPVEAGVPEEVVGAILAATTLMGLAGGALAAWLGTRLGRLLPLVAGSLFSAAGRWIFISSATQEWVFVGGLLWGLGFYFVSPYQIGLLAALDRHGRLAVAAGAAMNFGYALGPTVGGRVLQSFDVSAFPIVVVGATVLSLILLLPVVFQIERDARDAEQRQPLG